MAYTPPSSENANLIFSRAYTPPLGFEADLIFGEILGDVLQIWTDSNYVYASTTVGLDIYDIPSNEKYAYVTYSGGFNTVWANENEVFVGTSTAGIKYLNKACISGSTSDPYDLITCLNDFSDLTPYYNLTADNIRYIHGYEDIILVATISGIDLVKLNPQSYRMYGLVSGARKCFMTSTRKFYYTVSGTGEWSIDRMDTPGGNWPDHSYVTGSGVLASGIKINDIFVTERTGSDGISNTIFAATTSGVYVIDESDSEYVIYYVE